MDFPLSAYDIPKMRVRPRDMVEMVMPGEAPECATCGGATAVPCPNEKCEDDEMCGTCFGETEVPCPDCEG